MGFSLSYVPQSEFASASLRLKIRVAGEATNPAAALNDALKAESRLNQG